MMAGDVYTLGISGRIWFRILFNIMNATMYKVILKEFVTEHELEQAENCIFFIEEPSHISLMKQVY